MKISCNKLKQHINNSENIDWISIWEIFTVKVAEVESIEIKGEGFKNIVVGQIVECEKHPTNPKYNLLKVDNGQKIIDILCGAPNVRKNLKVALVNVGGQVQGITIEEKVIANFKSSGMLLSSEELQIGNDHSGIIELPDDYIVGRNIKEYIPIDDIIIEIDNKSLTNRPDLWGHYGIAREVAAITNNELKPLELFTIENNKQDLDIKVSSDLCLRYNGIKINNINITKTPYEIQTFLTYVGMRSLSLLVDLTNYIMLELGMPTHAFDSSKVNNIEVDLAKDGDEFTTLDGEKRILNKDILMIKSNNEYYAIAGVMGGKDSEVVENTNSIILESAVFDATSVRKTASALNLRTEASSRFEKSLDPKMCNTVIKRYIYLLNSIDSNIEIASNLTDIYHNNEENLVIKLTKAKLNLYLGVELTDERITNILNSLDFKTTIYDSHIDVAVPSYRSTKDITIEEDLIEEIARIYGYDNIEAKPLHVTLGINGEEKSYQQGYEVKNLLATKYNLNEAHTYLWEKTAIINKLNIQTENVKVLNKTEDNIIRNDMLGSLFEVLINNYKKTKAIGIFEIGTVMHNNENKNMLSIMLMDDEKNIEKNYFFGKEIITNIFSALKNINVNYVMIKPENYFYDSSSLGIFVNEQLFGSINILKNSYLKKKGIIYISIDFDLFLNLDKEINLYERQSKYPIVELDYTIITPKNYSFNQVKEIVDEYISELLMETTFVDIFNNEYEKRLTFRFKVGSFERTLTSEDLEKFKISFIDYIKSNNLNIVE